MPRIITGTNADEFIFGSTGNDTIYGRGGSDFAYGRAGNDRFVDENDPYQGRGSRDDFYFGGAGKDKFYTTHGNDYMDGGAGDDLFTGPNSDSYVVNGGKGNDTLLIDLDIGYTIEHHGRYTTLTHGDQVITTSGIEHYKDFDGGWPA
jgi:Ca2+-binding RTX toxin-like protein